MSAALTAVPLAILHVVYVVLSACGIVSKGWLNRENSERYM